MLDEVFTFLMSAYNVTLAHQLVRGRQPNGTVSVSEYYEGMIRPEIVEVNEGHALYGPVNLEVPLLVVTFPSGSRLVIDGYHRITRAYFQGVETLPCHVLSVEESARVQLYDHSPMMRLRAA